MSSVMINSPVEYGLYALAIKLPEQFAAAERFSGGMLAESQDAARRVDALVKSAVAVSAHDSGEALQRWAGRIDELETTLRHIRSLLEAKSLSDDTVRRSVLILVDQEHLELERREFDPDEFAAFCADPRRKALVDRILADIEPECVEPVPVEEPAAVSVLSTEEQQVADRAVRSYRMANIRKREVLQAAATQLFEAAVYMQQVWQNCCDYTGDAFENYPSSWPSFDEMVVEAGKLRVRDGYEFGDDS